MRLASRNLILITEDAQLEKVASKYVKTSLGKDSPSSYHSSLSRSREDTTALQRRGSLGKAKVRSIKPYFGNAAGKNDTTYYDSVYVKASEKTGATLITADDAFYERASKEVPTLHLRDLKDS